MVIRSWDYGAPRAARITTNVLVPLAAVAEMCDRTYYAAWDANLNMVLHEV